MNKYYLAAMLSYFVVAGTSVALADSYDVGLGDATPALNPAPLKIPVTSGTFTLNDTMSGDFNVNGGMSVNGLFSFSADVSNVSGTYGDLSNVSLSLNVPGAPVVSESFAGPLSQSMVDGGGTMKFVLPDFTDAGSQMHFSNFFIRVFGYTPFDPTLPTQNYLDSDGYPPAPVVVDVEFNAVRTTGGGRMTPIPSSIYALPVLLLGLGAMKFWRRRGSVA